MSAQQLAATGLGGPYFRHNFKGDGALLRRGPRRVKK
jgi:hypothetical protein